MTVTEPRDRVMILTPPGAAGIAVVRLAGPGVERFLLARFSRDVPLGRCVHGELRDDHRIVDDPVVVRCQDDVADLNVHGGAWVVRAVVDLARADGFELVEPVDGVPPDDAVDGQTPIDREVMRWLPRAATALAVRALLAQPAAWRDLWDRAARGQVGRDQLQGILDDASLSWLLSQPRLAIVGPANVGKSTLANRLFGQQRSITADVAGTTRDWVGEVANIDGLAVMLVDTPGRRQTSDPIERSAIEMSREQVAAADMVIIVVDRSTPLTSEARAILAEHPDGLVVANKADLPAAWDANAIGAIGVIATGGHGVDALRAAILRHFGCARVDPQQPRCWTDRQRAILRRAADEPARIGDILAGGTGISDGPG